MQTTSLTYKIPKNIIQNNIRATGIGNQLISKSINISVSSIRNPHLKRQQSRSEKILSYQKKNITPIEHKVKIQLPDIKINQCLDENFKLNDNKNIDSQSMMKVCQRQKEQIQIGSQTIPTIKSYVSPNLQPSKEERIMHFEGIISPLNGRNFIQKNSSLPKNNLNVLSFPKQLQTSHINRHINTIKDDNRSTQQHSCKKQTFRYLSPDNKICQSQLNKIQQYSQIDDKLIFKAYSPKIYISQCSQKKFKPYKHHHKKSISNVCENETIQYEYYGRSKVSDNNETIKKVKEQQKLEKFTFEKLNKQTDSNSKIKLKKNQNQFIKGKPQTSKYQKISFFKKYNTPKNQLKSKKQTSEQPYQPQLIERKSSISKYNINYIKQLINIKKTSEEGSISSKFSSKKSSGKEFKRFQIFSFTTQPKTYQFYNLRILAQSRGATVYLVLHPLTNSIFCLKKYIKRVQNIGNIISESKLLLILNHTNVVKGFGFFYDKFNFYILMQYMNDKTLREQQNQLLNLNSLQTDTNQMTMKIIPSTSSRIKKIKFILYQLTQSIVYLHNKNIIHRDLKPDNILISNDIYKIGDYGSSTFNLSQQHIGTLDYAAPQIILKLNYNKSVDLWSIGCIAYELDVGCPPFFHKEKSETMKRIINVQYDHKLINDNGLADCISKLLKKDSDQRISAQQLLAHQFLMGITEQYQFFS